MPRFPRRRKLAIGALVAVAAVTIGAAVLWRVAGHSDPVSLQDVLVRFRASARDASADGPPAAGVYAYRLSGREHGGAGPLAVTRGLPPQAVATVTRTSDGWETRIDYSKQHVEGARYVVRPDAIDMVWRRVDVSFAGLGRDDRRELAGRYRLIRLPARVGETWNDRYLAGTLENRVRTRVLREEDVDVGGAAVPTLVLQSHTVTTGAFSGTRDEILWWSPQLRVPVRSKLDVVVRGIVGYESHLDMTLTGLTPER